MLKRHRWLIALLAVFAVVAGACGGDDSPAVDSGSSDKSTTTTAKSGPPKFDAGTTMATLQSKGKLTVGTKFDQPLFGLKNPVTGAVEGFDVEMAKIVAAAIFGGTPDDAESKIEFVETVSKNREPFIQEGKVDFVVATYTINDTRKQVVDFAGPYYVAGQDIMVKADETTIRSVTDLNGKKVCSVAGSTSIKNVQEKAPQADVSTSFDKYSLCAEALSDGRVQAVTTDDIILLGLIKDNPGKFKLVKATFTSEPYGIGMKKGDDAFRTFVNDTIEKAYRDGSWKKAFDATVGASGEKAPAPPKVDRYTGTPAAPTTSAAGATTTTTAKP
ncbi:MAG TPA: glutamate ABC transporter substrate-binding protein [Acidimicrobiales bacterium]|nr:glutamate ABC transporter substrate-binding protein [Acidimicrobiales bacterium]